jgi:RHS repeat-associated protein
MDCLRPTYRTEFLSVWRRDAYEKSDHGNFLTLGEKNAGKEKRDNYYPFGLVAQNFQRQSEVPQNFKFQSQEHISDLGLDWDSFKWRNYQPDLGRFFNLDPLADKFVNNSPYAFSENKVISYREFEGLEGVGVSATAGLTFNIGEMKKLNFAELKRSATMTVGVQTPLSFLPNVNLTGQVSYSVRPKKTTTKTAVAQKTQIQDIVQETTLSVTQTGNDTDVGVDTEITPNLSSSENPVEDASVSGVQDNLKTQNDLAQPPDAVEPKGSESKATNTSQQQPIPAKQSLDLETFMSKVLALGLLVIIK